jgi:hypothetical protein
MPDKQKTDGEQTVNGKFAPGNSIGKQFTTGVSGNPSGRPRLTKITEALREQVSEELPDASEGTIAEAIARRLIKLALGGDIAAIREVLDRTEGRPKQSLDLDVSVQDWRMVASGAGLTEEEFLYETKLFVDTQLDDGRGSE